MEVRFFPDWGHRLPIWMGAATPTLTDELVWEMQEWVRVWQLVLDPVLEVRWPDPDVGRAWITEGNRLVSKLQAELGDAYIVKPEFLMFDPSRTEPGPDW